MAPTGRTQKRKFIMGLYCEVTTPIPEQANVAVRSFDTRSIQPYAVGNGRRFDLKEEYMKSVKELFNTIKKTRGVLIGTDSIPMIDYFTAVDKAKSEISMRINLIQTFDKGKAPPVVMVVETGGSASSGATIARLDLHKVRVANRWRSELGGGYHAFTMQQVVLHWVDQSEKKAG